MKRYLKLEKYIKKYTGENIKVFTVKYHKGGYGAYMRGSKGYMTILEELVNFKPLIWHEMGHLLDGDTNFIKNETKAQLAVFAKLKQLGYQKLYAQSLLWLINRWGQQANKNNKGYAKAKKQILNTMNKNPDKYYFDCIKD